MQRTLGKIGIEIAKAVGKELRKEGPKMVTAVLVWIGVIVGKKIKGKVDSEKKEKSTSTTELQPICNECLKKVLGDAGKYHIGRLGELCSNCKRKVDAFGNPITPS